MARLDGAGQAQIETLESALTHLQRVHAIIERMATAARIDQDTTPFRQQIQRAAAPLADLLRQQFDSVADQVTLLVLISGRGGSEAARLRALRESVGQIKGQIEVVMARVRQLHKIVEAE